MPNLKDIAYIPPDLRLICSIFNFPPDFLKKVLFCYFSSVLLRQKETLPGFFFTSPQDKAFLSYGTKIRCVSLFKKLWNFFLFGKLFLKNDLV